MDAVIGYDDEVTAVASQPYSVYHIDCTKPSLEPINLNIKLHAS